MKLSKNIEKSSQSCCLRATAQGIEEIDSVSPRFLNCSEIFLSHNSIKNIVKIVQFRFVSRLMLEYNSIAHIEDLFPLSKLNHLVELRIEGNPVCHLVLWDLYTIDMCKILRLLNGKVVRRSQNLSKFLEIETGMIDTLYHAEITRNVLNSLKEIRSPTPKRKSEILQKNYTKLSRNDFSTKIRADSPSKDKDSYLNYLKKRIIKVHSVVNSSIPKVNCIKSQTPNLMGKHNEILSQIKALPENELFLEASKKLSGIGLRCIGLLTDEDLTNEINGEIAKNEDISPMLKQGIILAQYNPENIKSVKEEEEEEAEEEEDTNDFYSPDLSIELISENLVGKNEYSPLLKKTVNCDFEVRLLEEEKKPDVPEEKPQKILIKNLPKLPIPDEIDSDSSFEMLNATPTEGSIPIADVNVSSIGDYSPRFLENPMLAARKKSRFSNEDFQVVNREKVMSQIAGIPNSFLGMKFFELWRRRFQKRVNRRVRRNALNHNSADLSYIFNHSGKEMSTGRSSSKTSYKNLNGDSIGSSEEPAPLLRSNSAHANVIPRIPPKMKTTI